jgi:membrane peptidoglycan carboxypeptidase
MSRLPAHHRIALKRRDRRAAHQRRTARRNFALFSGLIGSLLTLLLVVGIGGVGIALGVYWYYARSLPPPEAIINARQQFETTLIYDRTGKTVLYQVIDPNGGDRQWTALADVPRDLSRATIAIEDKSFWENPGFDVRGIARAVYLTVTRQVVQGGSSITQQLVKNTLIDEKDRAAVSLDRKIKEVILAGEISRRYSKQQILELYLNTNFYGNLAYGIDAASRVYFGKPVQNLTLAESALLAAIPQNPALNPLNAPQTARARQVIVLEKMVEQGFITSEQARQAASEPIVIAPLAERYNLLAPHFSIFARQQAEDLLNAQGFDGSRLIASGGLRVYTTLDLDLQYQTECVARSHIMRLAGGDPKTSLNTSAGTPCTAAPYLPTPPTLKLGVRRNVTNSAVVILKPNTGELVSLVGSLDYWNPGIDGNYNVALGLRQPGSTFKIFTYLSAFASGLTPGSLVWDVPQSFDQGTGVAYQPTNEDKKFHGPMSIRSAFANSYNIPAVSVLQGVGVADVIRKARLLGINSLNGGLEDYGLSLTLGSAEVSLLDLSYAYGVFANNGIMAGSPSQSGRPGYRTLDPIAVLRIDDSEGRVLWELNPARGTLSTRNIVPEGLSYLINDVLSDNDARLPAFGRGNALELSHPAAVKTGTTNDNRDAWTIGYTPHYVTGVWVGNNDNTIMAEDVSGGTGAAPIWKALMEYLHARDPKPTGWERPSTITETVVCKDTGLLPTPDCPRVREVFYADGVINTIPLQRDTYYKRFTINTRNGLIATVNTPATSRTDKIYFDFPAEYRSWARSAGYELPPTEFDTGGGSAATLGGAAITYPVALARVRGVVELRGNLENPEMVSYVLSYGIGLNPRDWVNIVTGDASLKGGGVVLGRWNAAPLDGLYSVRLQVVLKDRTVIQEIKQFTVDNRAPTVRITVPTANQAITIGDKVTFEVTARDNIEEGLSVEFYAGDKLLGSAKSAPYSFTWTANQAGALTIFAIATDSAGNQTRSSGVPVVVN